MKKSGWKAFEKAIGMKPEEVINVIKTSGLTGRGGANFSTGLKWELTRNSKEEKLLICNADEGEPGAFKDKMLIENNVENLLEGIAIASYAIGVKTAYIYLRGEYSYLKKKIEKEIKNAERYFDKIDLSLKIITGAGAYICGEETAIINSIEGERGTPATKPPYPASEGLWHEPTCINNVETLANVPLAINDNKWNKDLRLFSVSGDVKKPGVYEMSIGTKLKDVIEISQPKEKVKAIYFGCSGGCLPFKEFSELPLDYSSVSQAGAMLGSCTIIVVGEKQNIFEITKNIYEFFAHESCGKCTPCREGGFRMLEILEKISEGKGKKDDITLLEDLSDYIRETSLCGLGYSSSFPIKNALKYFREEFEKRCK
jgi:NADH:ubiquinone oxidoreductase subunit F (NADH-binding)